MVGVDRPFEIGNMGFWIRNIWCKMKIRMGWSSHFPVLIKALQITTGPVLELGTGLYSTPLMHWLCFDKNRPIVSYEHDPKYFKYNKQFGSNLHEMCLIEDWSKFNVQAYWDVVLIDCDSTVRHDLAKKLAYNSQYIVLHDTDPVLNNEYHYDEIFLSCWYTSAYGPGLEPGCPSEPEPVIFLDLSDIFTRIQSYGYPNLLLSVASM